MSKPIKLAYTAEEINRRLNLIDENKNLLPYPYIDSVGDDHLSDLGDGSLLVVGDSFPTTTHTWYMSTIMLPVGKKYISSLEVVNITNELTSNPGFSLSLELDDETITADVIIDRKSDNYGTNIIDLTGVAADIIDVPFKVILGMPWGNVSESASENLILRPQIEEVQTVHGEEVLEKTAWVPNMDKIGTYVDRRFNSTNAKIKLLNDELTNTSNTLSNVVQYQQGLGARVTELQDTVQDIANNTGGISQAFIVGNVEPTDENDKKLLWIDTSTNDEDIPTGGLKYYNGTSWVTVPVRFS